MPFIPKPSNTLFRDDIPTIFANTNVMFTNTRLILI
jgi:hypothetical protein